MVGHPELTRKERRSFPVGERMVQVPEMAESISEGTLKQFSKSIGDHVELDEEIATIETDKIDVAVNAPEAGTLLEFLVKEEDTVTVGQEIVKMDAGAAAPEGGKSQAKQEPKAPAADTQPTSSQPSGGTERQASSPQKQEDKPSTPSPQPSPQPSQQPSPSRSEQQQQTSQQSRPAPAHDQAESSKATESAKGTRDERRVKMNRMRLRIAERLKQSQNTAASLTTFQKVDMSGLMDFRKLYKDEVLKKTGVKLGFMSAFTRASVLAMKDIPAVNASIEGQNGGDTIVYRDYVDVSVAVATEKGLVTPVVRNCESLDLVGIESGIAELGKKARDNKLTIEDMAGGTFTISNGGVFGSLFGTPIINLPQTGKC